MPDPGPRSQEDVVLRAPRADELPAALETLRDGYAKSMVAHAGMQEAAAAAKAESDFARLCPQGQPHSSLDVFVVDEAGSPRGFAMLGERETEMGRVAFVYAIELDPEHRGRGLGRAAMLLVEQRARERGLERIELNVFGGNVPARSLYRSLGYGEIAVYMGKTL